MKLAASTVLLSLGGVPMVGNTATGGIIGLAPEGARLCRNLAEREVPVGAVPEGCHDLVEPSARFPRAATTSWSTCAPAAISRRARAPGPA